MTLHHVDPIETDITAQRGPSVGLVTLDSPLTLRHSFPILYKYDLNTTNRYFSPICLKFKNRIKKMGVSVLSVQNWVEVLLVNGDQFASVS